MKRTLVVSILVSAIVPLLPVAPATAAMRHHPELRADSCLQVHGPHDIMGLKVTNACGFPVSYQICDDASGKCGAGTVAPGRTDATGDFAKLERYRIFACRGGVGDVIPEIGRGCLADSGD